MYASWHWGRSSIIGLLLTLFLSSFQDFGPRLAQGLRSTVWPQENSGFFWALLHDVGLRPGATISVNISVVNTTHTPVFVILTHSQWMRWLETPMRELRGRGSSHSSYLISAWRRPIRGRLDIKFKVSLPGAERYYAGVMNERLLPLRLEGYVAYENPGGQHLKLQQIGLSHIWRLSSRAFLFLTTVVVAFWVRSRTGTMVHVHALLAFCLALKSAEMACKCRFLEQLSRHGDAPVWHNQAQQATSKLHAISEMLFMLLTALGWRVLRPLSGMEWRVIAFALTFTSCLVVLQELAIDATSDARPSMMNFALFFYTTQVSCHLVVLMILNLHIQVMVHLLQESPLSPPTAMMYHKYRTYLWFRRLFVAIMLRPFAVIWLRVSLFSLSGDWVIAAFSQGSLWLLYAGIFWTLCGPDRLAELVHSVNAANAAGLRATLEDDAGPPAGASPPPLAGLPAGEAAASPVAGIAEASASAAAAAAVRSYRRRGWPSGGAAVAPADGADSAAAASASSALAADGGVDALETATAYVPFLSGADDLESATPYVLLAGGD